MRSLKNSCTVEEDLIKKVQDLTKENKLLRKKLNKMKKALSKKKADLKNIKLSDTLDVPIEEEKCSCGGSFKSFSIRGNNYKICQKCKFRKKINK